MLRFFAGITTMQSIIYDLDYVNQRPRLTACIVGGMVLITPVFSPKFTHYETKITYWFFSSKILPHTETIKEAQELVHIYLNS